MQAERQARERRDEGAARGAIVARVTYLGAALVIIALVGIALLRVFIAPVAPTQAAPAGYPGLPCAVCHFVTGSVSEVEIP